MLLSNASTIYDISDFTIGSGAISYKVDKYTSGTDNLTVKIGNTTIATRNNVTGTNTNTYTKTITFSSAELTKIYNAMSKVTKATFTFIIESFISGESLGTSSTTAIGTLPSTIVPNLTDLTLDENVEDIKTKFGGYIKNKSKLDYAFDVTPATGTTISSYSFVFDGITYTKASGTTNIISKSGTLSYSAYVVDSRGRKSNTISKTITVLDYSAPQIASFKVVRCDASGKEDNKGLYAKYTIDASISSLNNKNDKSFNILYREKDTEDWQVWRMISNVYTLKETSSVVQINEDSWQFRVMLFDYFNPEENPISKIYDLSSTFLLFELTEELDGIAFGKTADESGVFDIGFEKTYLSRNTYLGGTKEPNEKNLHFTNAEDSQYYHNAKIYGGNATSPVALGMWDAEKSLPIMQYFDGEDYRLMFGSDMKLRHGTYAIESVLAKEIANNSGRIHYENGLLIQWGVVSIVGGSGTPTSQEIIFPIPFDTTPSVMTGASATVIGTLVLGTSHGGASKTSVSIYVNRTNESNTNVKWLAVGFKEV